MVGSTNSSNSNRLKELAEKRGVRSILIDGVNDIDPDSLAGVSRVGVTAGASAPDILVQEVVAWLRARDGAGVVEELVPAEEENVVFSLPAVLKPKRA